MPALQSYFDELLDKIKLQAQLRAQLQAAHQHLTEHLQADHEIAPVLVGSFLQGSYRRSTIVEPVDEEVADVDVVVVTRFSEHQFPAPAAAMRFFEPFLQRTYPGMWKPQDRSYAIADGRLKMDMVITSAPSEALQAIIKSRALQGNFDLDSARDFRISEAWRPVAERTNVSAYTERLAKELTGSEGWRNEPLRIPDRAQQSWESTHPLEQIDWAARKNADCNGRYLDVVRALKHWRRRHPTPKYPKGYPFEHLIGDACPDGISTTAEGIVRTLEELARKWDPVVQQGLAPELCDHGVSRNVLSRVTVADFAAFHRLVVEAAPIARQAYDAEDKNTGAQLWQKLFGPHFPDPPEWGRGGRGSGGSNGPGGAAGGFSPREEPGLIGAGRFG